MASSIFLLLSTFLSFIFSIDVAIASYQNGITLTAFTKLQFPTNVAGSGSFTFGLLHTGPYAGTIDGRILMYSRLTNSFIIDFGYTSPNRNKTFCDGKTDLIPTCGLTVGLSFNYLTQKLYACDPYVGLTVVGILGGPAVTLVRTTDAFPPYRSLFAVDVANDGNVYFTDTSSEYGPEQTDISRQTGDSTGRLLKYDPITKQVTTLLSKLARSIGVASNIDASFLLVAEGNEKRIRRYWLKGAKARTSEIFLTLQGNPNKIKRNENGDFWIGVSIVKSDSTIVPQGVKVSPSGQVLAIVDLSKEYNRRINVVAEQDGKLYVGGLNITYIGQYDIVYT